MRSGISVALLLIAGQSALAQQAVQQPVVGTMSVNTGVSVPDRGSVLLGGVSSAQSGRSQYGPLRSGTSSGITRQSTSITTNVYIIDLHAMDEALLNSRPAGSESRRSSVDFPANRPAREPLADREATPEIAISPTEKVRQHEELARKAELAGKKGVAKLHWQMAAKYGSTIAEKHLGDRALPPSPSPTQSASREIRP